MIADTGGEKVAYHWIGEPGDRRTVTYQQLSDEVNRFANGLRSLGVEKGDRVAIYMGMVPEPSIVFRTPKRSCSSPPTARGAVEPLFHSRRAVMKQCSRLLR